MKTVNLNINGCLPQVRDGNDGKDGVNGKSAYDLWLANGNTGSEADFLESLKGPKGADGINGTNGDKGDKGDSLFEDAKLEDGKLVITKPDGSKLEVPVPACPDVLFVDAFGKVELGYGHSVTCDKSETTDPVEEIEDTTEKTVIGVSATIGYATATSITVRAEKYTSGQPNPDPNTVIEGVAVTELIPLETVGRKPVHETPIERRVSFSAAYSEFPLTLSITNLPDDAFNIQGAVGRASHAYRAYVTNLSTSSSKVELREVETPTNSVAGNAL
jgi:putative uncharacterized protein (fragment)